MRSVKHRFSGSRGSTLTALMDLPDKGAPAGFALFAHCFTCTKDYKVIVNIDRALTAAGWAVFRFDFSGLGESGGDFGETNFSTNVEDLVLAARYVAETFGEPRLLMGHSLGGAAVLRAAHQVPSVRAVVTLAAPAEPSALTRHFEGQIPQIEREGEARVMVSGRPFTLRRQFLRDLERNSLADAIRTLPAALLVLHSPADDVVPIANAERIFSQAPQPKAFVALRGDHLLSREADARFAGGLIAAWASGYADTAAGHG